MTLVHIMKTKVGYTLVGLTILYSIAILFVPARLLIEIGDAFVIPMCAVAFWIYGMALIESDKRTPDHIDLLILGVFGGWLTNFMDRSVRLVSRIYDISIINSSFVGYLLLLLTFFAAVHILVKGVRMVEGKENYQEGTRAIMIALIIGFTFSCLLIFYHIYADIPLNHVVR